MWIEGRGVDERRERREGSVRPVGGVIWIQFLAIIIPPFIVAHTLTAAKTWATI